MTTDARGGGSGTGLIDRPSGTSLAEVIDTVLDKGLVIDAYVRVSLVGIELLTVDARIVVAGVDTYLRFAEAVNRLNLAETGNSKGLPDLVGNAQESGAKRKVKGAARGALESAGESVRDFFEGDDEEEGARGGSRRANHHRSRRED